MKRALSFGTYIFPDTQDQFSDNFTNTVTRTIRLPDLSGAFDELGVEPAPTETGSLKLKFLLLAQTSAEVTQKRDATRAMVGWGVRKLFVQPADDTLPPRYAYVRVQNIGMPENAKKLDTWQEVTMDFQVAYPRWLRDAVSGPVWGNAAWGDAELGGGPNPGIGSAVAGAAQWGSGVWGSGVWGTPKQNTLTYTNEGNAISLPRIIFTCTEAATSGLTIERLVNGLAADQLVYSQPIAAGQQLIIDCRSLAVTLSGSPAYADFDYSHPAWMRFTPGVNTLRTTLAAGGGTLRITYPHTWF